MHDSFGHDVSCHPRRLTGSRLRLFAATFTGSFFIASTQSFGKDIVAGQGTTSHGLPRAPRTANLEAKRSAILGEGVGATGLNAGPPPSMGVWKDPELATNSCSDPQTIWMRNRAD